MYDIWGSKNGIDKAHELVYSKNAILTNEHKDKYLVLLGNQTYGELYNSKEELIKGWKRCLSMSRNQDMSLYFNGNLIRSVINFNKKVTNTNETYPCIYIKYK